jgi:phage shock protein C
MFCTKCGVGLEERDNFCYQCGTATGKAPTAGPRKVLTRKVIGKKLAGVCGGFAEYIDADPIVVRLLWVLLSLGMPPAGILGYIIAWIVIPKETEVMVVAPAAPAAPQQV